MSLSSQQYASLADNSYNGPDPTAEEPIILDGVAYKILEHMDRPSGYQGTTYQRVDTGEIIVAHRGTEVDQGAMAVLQDAVLADSGMVLARANLQAADAIELTQRALVRAHDLAPKFGGHAPEVTVTGHSLGGTLAQIAAHRFDLRGETFNAYGAVSLDYGIPEGGDRVVNHVMAGDAVSAASHHYGQVRMYATPEEVAEVAVLGDYRNDSSQLDMRRPVLVAGLALDSHFMHNFLDVDGDNRPDRSVLGDPQAQRLAVQFQPMFDKYRGDICMLRGGLSTGAAFANGPLSVIDELGRRFGPATPPGQGLQTPEIEPGLPGSQLPMPWKIPTFQGPSGLYRDLPWESAPQSQSSRAEPQDATPSAGNDMPARLDRMLAAADTGDWNEFRKDTQALANGEAGRAMRAEAIATVDRQEQAEQRQAAQLQAMQQDNPVMRHGPRMH